MTDTMLVIASLLIVALFAFHRHQMNERRKISTSEFRQRLKRLGVK